MLALIFYILALFSARRALISISPALLLLAALLNRHRAAHWRAYWRNPAALLPAALYGYLLLSVAFTDDLPAWRHQMFRQSLLIVVPLALALAPPLPTRVRARLAAWWLGTGTAVAAATLAYFLRHRAAIEDSILRSKTQGAVTGVGHIYFGVMLALCTLYGLQLACSAAVGRRARWAAGGGALVCALTMHALAYRTGLVALYGAGAVAVVHTLVGRRRIGAGLLMVVVLAATPVAAYYALPSVRGRVAQTQDDLQRFRSGQDINEYSLSQRLAAWATAGALVQQHPVLGVGQADVSSAMQAQYAHRTFGLRPENRIMPHNQYLQYLVGGGVLTLALLAALLLVPMLAGPTRSDPFARHLLAAVGFALCFDSMLEVQYGLNPFILHYAVLVVAPWQRRALETAPPDGTAPAKYNPSGPAAV